ncbi:Trigger factor [bacterium HR15]|uniref:peptidylprolyl isomerase n=1 Tax=uncultured prokaryote TaxID=198431 RepID=H5S9G8_9ZZZZ|nr:trigger factor [uncultured prokaryote]GBC92907.1 Trigger factor [bacterium HR15]
MEITVQQLDPVNVQLHIEIEPEVVNRAFERAIRMLGKTVQVPGFRPGQAPIAVLRQHLPEEQVRNAVRDLLIEESLPRALQQHQLEPYTSPRVDIEQLQEGEPFRYKAFVPLPPQVELGDYHDIHIERAPQEATEEEVQQSLESLQEQFMELKRASDRPAQPKDRLVIRIRSLEEENAQPSRYMVILGESFGELDNALAGMREGETKTVTLTFPEDFSDEALAGKMKPIEITLEQIHAPQLPPLDDLLAQRLGMGTYDELREFIRTSILADKEQRETERIESELLNILRQRSTVHLPQVLIQQQAERELIDLAERLQSQGITLPMFMQEANLSQEQLIELLMQRAEVKLQNTFILLEIARREGIEVSPEEVQAMVQRAAQELATTPAERARLLNDPELARRIRNELLLDRTLRKLVQIVQNRAVVSSE